MGSNYQYTAGLIDGLRAGGLGHVQNPHQDSGVDPATAAKLFLQVLFGFLGRAQEYNPIAGGLHAVRALAGLAAYHGVARNSGDIRPPVIVLGQGTNGAATVQGEASSANEGKTKQVPPSRAVSIDSHEAIMYNADLDARETSVSGVPNGKEKERQLGYLRIENAIYNQNTDTANQTVNLDLVKGASREITGSVAAIHKLDDDLQQTRTFIQETEKKGKGKLTRESAYQRKLTAARTRESQILGDMSSAAGGIRSACRRYQVDLGIVDSELPQSARDILVRKSSTLTRKVS